MFCKRINKKRKTRKMGSLLFYYKTRTTSKNYERPKRWSSKFTPFLPSSSPCSSPVFPSISTVSPVSGPRAVLFVLALLVQFSNDPFRLKLLVMNYWQVQLNLHVTVNVLLYMNSTLWQEMVQKVYYYKLMMLNLMLCGEKQLPKEVRPHSTLFHLPPLKAIFSGHLAPSGRWGWWWC